MEHYDDFHRPKGAALNSNLMQSLPARGSSPPWNPPQTRANLSPSGPEASRRRAPPTGREALPKGRPQLSIPAANSNTHWKEDKGTIGPAFSAKGHLFGVPYESKAVAPRPPSPEKLREIAAQRAALSPTSPTSPVELRQCLMTWTGDQLEQMVRDKIQMKTAGGNGQILTALRLFEAEAAGEITPEMFQTALSKLLNTDISLEEAMGLFNKYDADGGGTLDTNEFTEQLLPGYHSITVKGQPAPPAEYAAAPAYVRKRGVFQSGVYREPT